MITISFCQSFTALQEKLLIYSIIGMVSNHAKLTSTDSTGFNVSLVAYTLVALAEIDACGK